jgi:hypothetical protein
MYLSATDPGTTVLRTAGYTPPLDLNIILKPEDVDIEDGTLTPKRQYLVPSASTLETKSLHDEYDGLAVEKTPAHLFA